jgi:hypothetical protein
MLPGVGDCPGVGSNAGVGSNPGVPKSGKGDVEMVAMWGAVMVTHMRKSHSRVKILGGHGSFTVFMNPLNHDRESRNR